MVVDAAFAAYGLVTCGLLAVSASTLWWMLHAWRRPDLHQQTGSDGSALWVEPLHSFSLLVPARHEQDVLGATLARLQALDHPDFEIVVVVGHDDVATYRVASQGAQADVEHTRVVVDQSWPKSKPGALNSGLAACTKEIVGIFDAEDEVSLDILRQVDAAFTNQEADVVQAAVQLVTLHSCWFSLRNCLEYLFWFRSRIHAHTRRGLVPLGGNTVFVRRQLLEEHGGWVDSCLAEDCELGVRLSASGARIVVSYDPRFATREETPATLRAFVRQRTRWSQGYIQVFRCHRWKCLPTRRQRVLAVYVLLFPVVQGLSGLLILVSVATFVAVKMPLELAMFTSLPALVQVMVVCFEIAGLSELRRAYYLKHRWSDYPKLVLTAIPFQLVLAFAAARATWRELRGSGGWEKTAHMGAHRSASHGALASAMEA